MSISKIIAVMSASVSFCGFAALPELTAEYNDPAGADFTTTLTWTGDGAVTLQRRMGDSGAWQDLDEFTAGDCSYNDTSALVGVRYGYRLVNASEEGSVVTFRRLERISTSGATVVSEGDFTSEGWCKAPYLAFDGSTGNDSYPDSVTDNPRVGLDFGSQAYHVGYVRLYPRVTNNCEGRLNGCTIYGTADFANGGTALSAAMSGVGSGGQWYALAVDGTSAYTCFYYMGAFGGNVCECEFYGYTDAQAALSDAVAPIDASLTLAVSGVVVDESYDAVLAWSPVNCGVTLQRREANGSWSVVAALDGLDGTYTDTSASVGHLCYYRLQAGVENSTVDNFSPVVSFRRLRKLSVAGATLYTNAGGTGADELAKAFNGDTSDYPDVTSLNLPRIGVDFGRATNHVAYVRFFPRQDYYSMRLSHLRVYGSAASTAAGSMISESLGTVTAYDQGNPDPGIFRWYGLEVDSSVPYRCYYAYKNGEGEGDARWFYGNLAEFELYGWTLADDGEEYVEHFDCSFGVEDNVPDGIDVAAPDFSAKLAWDRSVFTSNDVTLQRSRSASGPWSDLVSVASLDSYVDDAANCGVTFYYRIAHGSEYSQVLSYRRLRRFTVPADMVVYRGTPYDGNSDGSKAFDDNTSTYTDLSMPARVGVDFGEATNYVVKARYYPRNTFNGRLNNVVLYGTDSAGAAVADGTSTGDTVVMSALTPPIAMQWYTKNAGEFNAYRSYYLGDFTEYGNVAELQLYGWTEDESANIIRSVATAVDGNALTVTATVKPGFTGEVKCYLDAVGPGGTAPASPTLAAAANAANDQVVFNLTGVKGALMLISLEAEGNIKEDSVQLTDDAAYTWKASATGERAWEDAANWESDAADPENHLGWPGKTSAAVSFANAGEVTVSVSGDYEFGNFSFGGSGACDVTFVGTGAETSSLRYGGIAFGSNKTVAFGGLTVRGPNLRVGDNDSVSFVDGAQCNLSWWLYVTGARSVFRVGAGATVNTSVSEPYYGIALNGLDAEIVVEGRITGRSLRIARSEDWVWPGNPQPNAPKGVTFRGPDAAMVLEDEVTVMNEFLDGGTPVFTFNIPVGGYAAAPLRASRIRTDASVFKFAGDHYRDWNGDYSGHAGAISSAADVAFAVDPASPFFVGVRTGAEVPLLYWPLYNSDSSLGGGINASRVTLRPSSSYGNGSCALTYVNDGEDVPVGINAVFTAFANSGMLIIIH